MNLRERLKQTPEQLADAALDRKLEQAKLQAQNELSETRYELSLATERLEKAYLADPFSLQGIIDAKDAVSALKKGYDEGEKILTECFGK